MAHPVWPVLYGTSLYTCLRCPTLWTEHLRLMFPLPGLLSLLSCMHAASITRAAGGILLLRRQLDNSTATSPSTCYASPASGFKVVASSGLDEKLHLHLGP
ncbi:hypothetical protein F4808DRAFT_429152 [Astrocystis sublimbata]|nr:hypothetical protein F4808DRAFT_429152 [Astrocystis sublimbata]